MRLTQEQIKNFKPTKDMIKYTELVFVNMAKVQTIKPIVEKIQQDVLKEFKFKVSKKNQRRFSETDLIVLTENRTYLLSDSDFKKYHSECIKRESEKGLYVSDPEHCPLLVAESNLIKSENDLINSFEHITGLKNSDIYKLEHRKRFLDITLKFMVKFIRGRQEILRDYNKVLVEVV